MSVVFCINVHKFGVVRGVNGFGKVATRDILTYPIMGYYLSLTLTQVNSTLTDCEIMIFDLISLK